MKCPSCGQENTSNARFCGSCRVPLSNPGEADPPTGSEPPTAAQENGSRGFLNWVLPLCIWFWTLILVLGGFAEIGENNSGGMLILVGSLLCFLSGLTIFRKTLLFGLPRYKTAIALFVFSFILFVMGIPSDTGV